MGLLVGPMSTQAAVVTYEVKGVVDSFDAGNGLLPWTSSDIAVGSQFSVLYEYDDAFPDSNANPNIGTYQESIISMVVTIGAQSFALPLGTGGGAGDQAHTVANDVLQGGNYVDQLAYTRVGCVNFAPSRVVQPVLPGRRASSGGLDTALQHPFVRCPGGLSLDVFLVLDP